MVVRHIVRRGKLEYFLPTGQMEGRRAVVDIPMLVVDLIAEMQRQQESDTVAVVDTRTLTHHRACSMSQKQLDI